MQPSKPLVATKPSGDSRSINGIWSRDYGEGSQVAWYNKKALSVTELNLLKRRVKVSDNAKDRINDKINNQSNKHQ